MSSPGSQDTGAEDKKPRRLAGSWHAVDLKVWTRRGPPAKGLHRISLSVQRVGSLFLHPVALPFLGFAGILAFIGTFALAFFIGGPGLFGPVLLAIWSIAAVFGVLIIEKSGYARNFEEWDFPARKMLHGILGMLLALTFMFLLIFLLGHH